MIDEWQWKFNTFINTIKKVSILKINFTFYFFFFILHVIQIKYVKMALN
jgi:hypothetical protein